MGDVLIPTAGILGLSGLGVLLSGRREHLERWLSWLGFATVLLGTAAFGVRGTTAFAALAGVICAAEYARLAGLSGLDRIVAVVGTAAAPVALRVSGHGNRTVSVLVCVGLLASFAGPLLQADAEHGFDRATRTAFGLIWLGVPLCVAAGLGVQLLPIVAAVSLADVGAYLGGHLLGRRGVLAHRLSAVSPNKTWAGALTGTLGAAIVLAGLTGLHLDGVYWTSLAAVVIGGVGGDLIESMIKRGVGVKDAGAWLPGFGGLLDRLDSALGALTVLALFGALGLKVVGS